MRRTHRLLLAATAPLLALAASVRALDIPFVYDDVATVVGNPSLRDLGNWAWVLTYERFRPLVNVSHALERAAFGLSPVGHHATNILLHGVNATLLYLLGARLPAPGVAGGDGRPRALLAASLWAVHPVMASTVGYVSARADLMVAAGIFTALLLHESWLASGRTRFIPPMLLAFAAALACKETAAVVPLLMVARASAMAGRPLPPRRRAFYAVLVLLVALAGLLRIGAFFAEESRLPRLLWWRYPLTEAGVAWRYLALLAFPRGQSIVHSVPWVSRPTEPAALFPLAGLLGLALLALRLRRERPVAAVGLLGFLLTLAPTSVVPLAEVMAEHRVYVPAAWLFLAVADLASTLRVPRRAAGLAAAATLALLLVLTMRRHALWSDPVALWREGAARAPDLYAPSYWLAEALRGAGDCAGALPHYLTAVEIEPSDPSPYPGLASCLEKADGADERALAVLSRAVENQAPPAASACLRLVLARRSRNMTM